MKSMFAILALSALLVPASAVVASAPAVPSVNENVVEAACKLGMYYRGPAGEEFGFVYATACSAIAPQTDSGSAMPALDAMCRMHPKFAIQQIGDGIALACFMITPQPDSAQMVLPLAPVPAPCPAGLKYVGPASQTFAGVACLDLDVNAIRPHAVTKELPLYWCSALECTPQGKLYLLAEDLRAAGVPLPQ